MYSVGLAILIIGASGSAGALVAEYAHGDFSPRSAGLQTAIIGCLIAAIGMALLSFPV